MVENTVSNLHQVYHKSFMGTQRDEMKNFMNLAQVYHKAFVKESKMFEFDFNRRCTNKFS